VSTSSSSTPSTSVALVVVEVRDAHDRRRRRPSSPGSIHAPTSSEAPLRHDANVGDASSVLSAAASEASDQLGRHERIERERAERR
jgi:hypothetical protein